MLKSFPSCLSVARAVAVALVGVAPVAPTWAQANAVYRCPGNLYTSELSPRQAQERGCRTIDGAPITIVQIPRKPPPVAAPAAPSAARSSEPATTASRPADTRVDSSTQRQRDSDARRILEEELRREEDKLASLKREYNGGEPERRGDERNYQKYLDRVAEMKASILRSESDIAAIRRELAKAGP